MSDRLLYAAIAVVLLGFVAVNALALWWAYGWALP